MKRFVVLAGLLVVACARYDPLPLPERASLAPSVSALRSVPQTPLTIAEVTELAVDRNPELVAARTKRGVAQAQVRAAGVLPNPSLAAAFLPLIAGVGTGPAWNVGLAQDIKALIVYRPKLRAARDAAAQVDADLLWQEWQVIGQARQLAIDFVLGRRARAQLAQAYDLLANRNAVMQRALARQDVTIVTAAPSAAAVQAARASLQAAEAHELELHHKLATLLALAPDAQLPLADTVALPRFDPESARAAIADLPRRRPDLLALRCGYAASDETLRMQILAQFPDLILGGTGQSDSSQVINAGPTATVGLPLFDRNQGNVAAARATRAQLHAEYTARLATATGEVGALVSEWETLARQLAVVRDDLPQARLAAERAAAAFGGSALDERSYIDLVTAYFAKDQEITMLETALADREVAIETLTGAGLPSVDILPALAEQRE